MAAHSEPGGEPEVALCQVMPSRGLRLQALKSWIRLGIRAPGGLDHIRLAGEIHFQDNRDLDDGLCPVPLAGKVHFKEGHLDDGLDRMPLVAVLDLDLLAGRLVLGQGRAVVGLSALYWRRGVTGWGTR